jgi:hypothetical protein
VYSTKTEKAARRDDKSPRSFGVDLRWGSAVFLVLLLSGCGYSFSGMNKEAYPTVHSVYVDTFTNRTSEAGLDITVRAAFINEISRQGHYRLASNQGEADAIFRGTIINLTLAPLAYKAGSFSAENRITVILALVFEERASGRTLWSNGSFIGFADYFITDVGTTDISRKTALTKLASDTAERAYRLMMSNF